MSCATAIGHRRDPDLPVSKSPHPASARHIQMGDDEPMDPDQVTLEMHLESSFLDLSSLNRACHMRTCRVPSLVDCARKVVRSNVDLITDIGDCPLHLVDDLLESRASSSQMISIEEKCPYLVDEGLTEHIWKTLCERRFRHLMQPHLASPSLNTSSWRNEYIHLQNLESKKMQKSSENLRSMYSAYNAEKKSRQIQLTDPKNRAPKHPQNRPESRLALFLKQSSSRSSYTQRKAPRTGPSPSFGFPQASYVDPVFRQAIPIGNAKIEHDLRRYRYEGPIADGPGIHRASASSPSPSLFQRPTRTHGHESSVSSVEDDNEPRSPEDPPRHESPPSVPSKRPAPEKSGSGSVAVPPHATKPKPCVNVVMRPVQRKRL